MKALIIITAIAAFGFVGNMDYTDAVNQEARYCEMVNAGNWQPYKANVSCSTPLNVKGK